MKRPIAMSAVSFAMILVLFVTVIPSIAQEFIRYTGKYERLTNGESDLAILEMTLGEQVGNRLPVTGRIAFRPSESGFCVSGHFEGDIFQDIDGRIPGVNQGDYYLSIFTTNRLNEECESELSISLLINATFTSNLNIVDGKYFYLDTDDLFGNSGTFGGVSTKEWDDLEKLRDIAERRRGTLNELYSRFWSCLNEDACNGYQKTGEDGISGGFNKFMFDYMRRHPNQNALDIDCGALGIITSQPNFPNMGKIDCFSAVATLHFNDELRPGFRAYCEEIIPEQYENWDRQHIEFIENINIPCFNPVLDGMG